MSSLDSEYQLSPSAYAATYKDSVHHNENFWGRRAKMLDWYKPFSEQRVRDISFSKQDVHIRWFDDGELNICANCIDRHLKDRAEKTAIIWEADEPGQSHYISYRELHGEVCQLANGLQSIGIGAGDRVVLYMPMIPHVAYAMLACARIGAVHCVVFGGFSASALAERILDCEAKLVITADTGVRGRKPIALKANVDAALDKAPGHCVESVLTVRATGDDVACNKPRDMWYHDLIAGQNHRHIAQAFNAEHPLFILYTSGSTGKPKGLLHTSGGYLTYVASTFCDAFDYRENDVHWCTADVGWVTGHSYVVYGPLANGATTVMYEGVPNYPTSGRFGEVIDRHKVTLFYTAPTAIRTLIARGDESLNASRRDSLRILGTAGEPINPQAWHWYHDEFGARRCPIADTWWQTETGGMMILPLPGAMAQKPGAAGSPYFGIQPQLVDEKSDILDGATEGHLVILDSWPGQARTIWGDHQRFVDTYFSRHEGMYFTGDGVRRDEDGHYWITGRVDDVLNVSGHRLGTAEVESAVVSHPLVAEAAVVGYPHAIKGEAIHVYVIAMDGIVPDEILTEAVKQQVRKELGPMATPDRIQWAAGLPKTRSGKIMRRILRKIAADDFSELGDISTLAEPEIVPQLIAGRTDPIMGGTD